MTPGGGSPSDKAARSVPSYLCLVSAYRITRDKNTGFSCPAENEGEGRVVDEVWLYSINGVRGNYLMNLAVQGKKAAVSTGRIYTRCVYVPDCEKQSSAR